MSAYSLRTRGFIRGSIPLSSTIKRLVRRGSGKANGQKSKMHGHADRIAGQDKGSGKLPALLDYFLKGAYNWEMTTSRNTQRDELLDDILASALANLTDYTDAPREIADTILSEGYRKPRTITTVEELDALPDGSAILDGSGDVAQKLSGWWHFPETSPMGPSKVLKYSATVTVIHEPEAEATA